MDLKIKLEDDIHFEPTDRGKYLLKSKYPAYNNKMPLDLFLKCFASEARGALKSPEITIKKSFWDLIFKR